MGNNNRSRLEQLIERYFEGETSLAEERELKHLLADDNLKSPTIDEARAVLGYAAASKNAGNRNNKLKIIAHKALKIAAFVALMVGGTAVGLKFGSQKVEAATRCVAYVDAVKITDDAVIMQMALNDLRSAVAFHEEIESNNRRIMTEMSVSLNEINEIYKL